MSPKKNQEHEVSFSSKTDAFLWPVSLSLSIDLWLLPIFTYRLCNDESHKIICWHHQQWIFVHQYMKLLCVKFSSPNGGIVSGSICQWCRAPALVPNTGGFVSVPSSCWSNFNHKFNRAAHTGLAKKHVQVLRYIFNFNGWLEPRIVKPFQNKGIMSVLNG